MAKSTIRKSDPESTSAPARRRRTPASDTAETTAASKPAARSRRKGSVVMAAPDIEVSEISDTEITTDLRTSAELSHEQIALRAYHLFLERGGYPGDQFQDWVTAERQLREQSAGEGS